MRALVVYESMFHNTQRVAESIASGLRPEMDAIVLEVGTAPSLVETPIDLLVLGGPTQAFRMSRPESRKGATKKTDSAVVSQGIGIREWISAQKGHSIRVSAATFDTRFKMSVGLTGSAARSAQRKLRKAGFAMIASAESFFVEHETGPLHPGEEDRAFQWGETLTFRLVTGR
jgi:hypothetical protein